VAAPAAPLIAAGIWWNSNTVAHNFIHRPFFRARSHNLIFSACQSVLMGIPQALWRERHLAHHAGVEWRLRWSPQLAAETGLVCTLWIVLVVASPWFFIAIYLPGYAAGLALCAMQGHYEHAGATISHYGRLYNLLCFNDGYHVEHHAYPGVHWRALPHRRVSGAHASRWPALLRWMETRSRGSRTKFPHAVPSRCSTRFFPELSRALDALERLVLRWHWLQRFVIHVHRDAFRRLLQDFPPLRRVAIVGGGLFPRTAIVLRELLPGAELVVIEASRRHVDTARRLIGADVTFEHARFEPGEPAHGFDLIVIPLAFQGDRCAIYRRPPAPAVVVHDWFWRRRGRGCIVSLALLKRLNLIRP
jgi:hypothetical protein